jgi:hypothetical protein
LSISQLSFVIVSKLVVLLSWMLMLHQRCTKEALLQQMIFLNIFGPRYEFFVWYFFHLENFIVEDNKRGIITVVIIIFKHNKFCQRIAKDNERTLIQKRVYI